MGWVWPEDPTGWFGGVVAQGGEAIAHILVRLQDAVEPSFCSDIPILPATNLHRPAFCEAFVQSFAVEERWRRKGIGTRLQRHAIEAATQQGARQLRSWSSLDAIANHRLKLRLGFAAVAGYWWVPHKCAWAKGTHFVLPLSPAPQDDV